jgi:hypothetical protein
MVYSRKRAQKQRKQQKSRPQRKKLYKHLAWKEGMVSAGRSSKVTGKKPSYWSVHARKKTAQAYRYHRSGFQKQPPVKMLWEKTQK